MHRARHRQIWWNQERGGKLIRCVGWAIPISAFVLWPHWCAPKDFSDGHQGSWLVEALLICFWDRKKKELRHWIFGQQSEKNNDSMRDAWRSCSWGDWYSLWVVAVRLALEVMLAFFLLGEGGQSDSCSFMTVWHRERMEAPAISRLAWKWNWNCTTDVMQTQDDETKPCSSVDKCVPYWTTEHELFSTEKKGYNTQAERGAFDKLRHRTWSLYYIIYTYIIQCLLINTAALGTVMTDSSKNIGVNNRLTSSSSWAYDGMCWYWNQASGSALILRLNLEPRSSSRGSRLHYNKRILTHPVQILH